VASSTNRLTLIAAVLPGSVVSTHTVFCLKSPLDIERQWCLCALFNSFVANWLVRLRVGVHVTVAVLDRVPMPQPTPGTWLFGELVTCARALARAGTIAGPDYVRLQALAAHAYRLRPADFEAIVSTFPLIPQSDRAGAVRELARLQSL
jgi:hypothetical protein